MAIRKHLLFVPGFVTSCCILCAASTSTAVTTVFFNSGQTTNIVPGQTWDTVTTEGYSFKLSMDKLFTGGGSEPTGRFLRVKWPDGLEAQAVTSGPVPSSARVDLTRLDGTTFGISSLTFKLLANTAGAGGSLEIMPLIKGQDGRADPFVYDATGYGGQSFTYTTPELAGFDAYKMTLYVDFAITSLTAVDASIPPPYLDVRQIDAQTLHFEWTADAVGYVLESANSLRAPTWGTVTNAVTEFGGLFMCDVAMDSPEKFYRLRK